MEEDIGDSHVNNHMYHVAHELLKAQNAASAKDFFVSVLRELGYNDDSVENILSLYDAREYRKAANNILTLVGKEVVFILFSPNAATKLNVNTFNFRVEEYHLQASRKSSVTVSRREVRNFVSYFLPTEGLENKSTGELLIEFLDYLGVLSVYNVTEDGIVNYVSPLQPGDVFVNRDNIEVIGVGIFPQVAVPPVDDYHQQYAEDLPKRDFNSVDSIDLVYPDSMVDKAIGIQDEASVPLAHYSDACACVFEEGVSNEDDSIAGEIDRVSLEGDDVIMEILQYVDDIRPSNRVSKLWHKAAMCESYRRFMKSDFYHHLNFFDRYGQRWLVIKDRDFCESSVWVSFYDRRDIAPRQGRLYNEGGERVSLFLEHAYYNVIKDRGKVLSVESITDVPIYKLDKANKYLIYNIAAGYRLLGMSGLFLMNTVHYKMRGMHGNPMSDMSLDALYMYLMACTIKRRLK